MDQKNIAIQEFNYELPEEKIALFPLERRDASKLLVYKKGSISEDTYLGLDSHIPAKSLLIFNNTRVLEARIIFKKTSGAEIELFCLESADLQKDISLSMMKQQKIRWKCMIGGASKWKPGEILIKEVALAGEPLVLRASYVEKRQDGFIIEFSWTPELLSFAEVLHLAGQVPLPPYLKRAVEATDAERYQTIYAQHEGSVAAPTAGLHFTDNIFSRLHQKGISHGYVTLHVGAGTFKPVKSPTLASHEMHAEIIEVRADILEKLLEFTAADIIAVGTTSMRTLETIYWLGVKTYTEKDLKPESLDLDQWEVYQGKTPLPSREEALESLLNWMKLHKLSTLLSRTRLLIVPGYQFKMAMGLITNFHQPQSTLLLLVAAMVGNDWKRIYQYALTHDFRFLSYGDGCLLFNQEL